MIFIMIIIAFISAIFMCVGWICSISVCWYCGSLLLAYDFLLYGVYRRCE